MLASCDIGFKEWAIVVEALGSGEQIVVFRKGGIGESRGAFEVDHREFWLFPTQYHEVESSVIASKRPGLRELQSRATNNVVEIEFYAVVADAVTISEPGVIARLQGMHIWTEKTLQERFEFGRQPGLHALITRVYRMPRPERFPWREDFGGCKSWVQFEHPISTVALRPVLADTDFSAQRKQILELLCEHAFTRS